MRKRVVRIALTLCMITELLFSLSTNVIAESIWGPDPINDGFYSYIVIDNEAAIVDVDKDDISGNIIIPSTLGGYPVTTIWDTAFFGCSNLTGVTIPKGINKIGEMAFGHCNNLSKINIADGVTDFAGDAFYNTAFYDDANNWENHLLYIGNYLLCAQNINSAKIKEGTTIICNGAFEYCNYLQEVYIPESVKYIGNYAFYDCGLREISIPEHVTYIGNYAFSGTPIKSVIISEYVTYIGDGAFACRELTNITISTQNKNYCSIDGHLFTKDKKTIIQYAVGRTDDTYTIPDGVTSIGDGAFYYSKNLKEVIISDNVESIGNNAFTYACIEKITIPSNVKHIGDNAFNQNRELTSITILDGLQTIGAYAFSMCSSLQQICIPNSVVRLGEYAFDDCTSLKEIQLSNSLTTIENRTFSGCRGLNEIVIPENVKTIKSGAFEWCENLLTVMVGRNVEKIEQWSFSDCNSLANIFVSENNPYLCDINGNVFSKDKKTIILYAPGKMETIYNMPNSVLCIGERAFSYNENLREITIPNSTTTIDINAFYGCENLVKVNLSSGLIEICEYAFSGCTSLEEIKLPESVTHIGNSAFSRCSSLENINIPSKVTQIEPYTFTSCSALKNVKLHDNITKIGYDAFSGCKSLTDITIPKGLTEISWGLFNGCSKLSRVFIPDSIEVIGTSFEGCTALSDIYYSGSKEDWEKIYISEYNNDYLTNATIHYTYYKKPIQISDGTFNFASGNKRNEEFYYDDNYFVGSSYTYNHDLAKMSIRLALSAYAKKTGSGENKDYSKQYINAYNLLDSCDFENIELNIDYKQQPWVNGIGVIAGNKKIAYDDGDYTLIAVALRGGGYEAEWGGNFNVGNSEYHDGFKTASSFVIQFIQDYIENNKINGNVKLWITGFSRAAAATNLTAAYFDEHPEWLHDDVTFTRDNLFAYCFETPAGVVDPYNESGIYNNIFSIVNQHDPVPMVAMRNWGFDRYGITKYLPTAQTNSNYTILKSRMVQNYNEYVGNNKEGLSNKDKKPYKIDTFSKFSYMAGITGMHDYINAQGVYLEKTIDKLADAIGSTANYKEKYQDALVYIGEELMGYKDTDAFVQRLLLEISARTAGKEAFGLVGDVFASNRKILKKSIESAFNYVGVDVEDEDVDVLLGLVVDLGFDDFITLLKNFGNLGQAHHPELCMAWLDAIDEEDFRDKRLRTLYLNCPIDLEVYDSNNKLVAAISNNVSQKIEGSSIVAYIDENGQKVVYLPTDEEYRIEVIATDDSEVTYSIQEKNADTGETKVINYNKMAMKKNDTLTGTAESINKTEVATYTLTSNSVTIEEPEVIENATPVAVTPVAEGNGNVTGGGSLLKGEYAQFTAIPLENETFIGWYNGDTLVSSETTYRFQVAEAVTLTAKFTENTCEIAFFSTDDDVVYVKRILKGNKVTFPTMNQNENYIILDVYTDKVCLNPADENTVYSEDTILYLDCVHKNNWVQLDEVNNKVVVYSPTAMTNVQLMVALYEEERLTGLSPNTINLLEGKNEINNPLASMGTADALKIFVWDGLSSLKPIFKNCVVDLK